VSTPDKKEALNAVSNWTVEDCRPFSAVTGFRFRSMVQFFIKIGSTYRELVYIDDLIPDPTSIARECQKEAEEKKADLSTELKEVVSRGEHH